MIRQATAAKTCIWAGPGQEAAEGRETLDTAAIEGSKKAYLLPPGRSGKNHRFLCCFHTASSLGKRAA